MREPPTKEALLMSMCQPVRRAARRAFWPSLPMASESWSSGTMTPALEGLTGKHAIYLVAEGPEVQQPEQPQEPWARRPQQPQHPQGLFNLHGIGFKKASETLDVPVVPEVTITVDGQKLNIPAQPIMATNQNGYTECNHYQLYAPLKADSKVQATCENVARDVQFDISPVVAGRATVRATYQGKEKIFLIN